MTVFRYPSEPTRKPPLRPCGLNGTKGDSMRILVVEDESALRENLRQKFASIGYGVDVAADGEEGLSAGLAYNLDAAIVDLGLPLRDGLSIIQYWRACARNFPILILTGRDNWRDKVHSL